MKAPEVEVEVEVGDQSTPEPPRRMKAGGTMGNSDDLAAREGARAELLAIATEFRRAAGPATDAALHWRSF